MTTKSFPIPVICTECGHKGDVFVNDETVKSDLDEYRKSRFMALWVPLAVRRIFILAAGAFTVGVLLGQWCAR